jgi:hypothetical protein
MLQQEPCSDKNPIGGYLCLLGNEHTDEHAHGNIKWRTGKALTDAIGRRLSHRGLPVFMPEVYPESKTVLTVEDYDKWYGLQVLHETGLIVEITFPTDPYLCFGIGAPYRDHVPNPYVARRLCMEKGWEIPERAWEVMVGRWIVEISDDKPIPLIRFPEVPAFEFTVKPPRK